jgi:DNA-binding winged helix-turn-helix (wHTH) protein/TolB-like protein/tetratricopeptide (TPR) repeat protein
MKNQDFSSIQFDDIRVETRNFKIFKANAMVPLEPKTFLLLTYLIENRDRLVEKRELLDAVWKDTAVTENSLTREIGKLRRALGDDPKTPNYIETVHTRGYRFIAEVREVDDRIAEAGQTAEPPVETIDTVPPVAAGAVISSVHEPGKVTGGDTSRWVPYQLFAGLTLAVLLLTSTLWLLRKPPETAKASTMPKPGSTTLAVLPFQSLGAPDDRYVGLAIADALITKLSNSVQLAVQPLSTVVHYADSKSDALSVGRAMHVDYVLEGKYQRLGDHTRVTVQLLCIACNGTSRWAASFDETSKDFFQVQDSISQKVVASLPLDITREVQQRIVKRETNLPEAQMAVFKGKFFQNEDTKEGLEKSIEHLQLAVRRDPRYAAGWALLSDSYRRREWYGGDPNDFLPLTREAARKANELDANLAYGHSMSGLIAFEYDWDFATAEREYARARRAQASWVHQWYARMLLATDRAADAQSEYDRFVKLAPFSESGRAHYAEFLFLTGQYPRAIDQIHRCLEMDPNFPPAHELLGLVYEQQGLNEKAEEEFKKASGLSNGLSGLSALGHLYATSGRMRHTQDVFDEMRAHRKDRYVSPYEFAVIHAALGYNRRALGELEEAYNQHSLSAQSLRCDPRLNNLRRDPGYQNFAKKLGVI